MKPLDDELRSLFKHKEPPEGFAEQVLARLDAPPPRPNFAQRLFALYRRPRLRWATAAVVVCVLAILGIARYEHQQRIRAQAEQASREAIFALRITRIELNVALERAQRATERALVVPKNSKQEME